MNLVNLDKVVFSDNQKTSGVSYTLCAGESFTVVGQEAAHILSYLKGQQGILGGSIEICNPAVISPPPQGLLKLTTADFLKAIYFYHHPDQWDGFRKQALLALDELSLSPKLMNSPLGELSGE